MIKKCAEIWSEVRNKTPLVHCITNYVTVNDVANIILASGASPAMVEHPRESGGFAAFAAALYLNMGTLTGEQELAMIEAVKGAAASGKPLIIDPVACGVIPRKVEVLKKLEENGKITCIKGNGSEIKSLAGMEARARGVDSLDQGEGLKEACQHLAIKQQAVAIATGAVDIVAESGKLALVKNGTPLFTVVTGAGCMVGGVIAACIGAVPGEPWLAAVTGLLAYNIAGEHAAEKAGDNPGTFHSHLIDSLYHLRPRDIIKQARVEWRKQ